jgi:hypothetical protein
MARITILALVLLLLGGLAGSAAAAQPQQPRLALIARDVQKLTTDGQRYIAFQQGHTISVIDATSGRRYRTRLPAQCSMDGLAAGTLSFPRLLEDCGNTESDPALLNVRSGALLKLPADGAWDSVGRDWVEGGVESPCPGTTAMCEPFYQWHTETTRYLPVGQLQRPPEQFLDPDLDSPGLTLAAPCAPYQGLNRVNGDDSYDSPYLLLGDDGGSFSKGLQLGRCGSRPTIALASAAGSSAELSAGNASWVAGSETYDYDIATKRTYHWSEPATTDFDTPLAALHTRDSVLIARTTRQACNKLCTTTDVDLYLAKLGSSTF